MNQRQKSALIMPTKFLAVDKDVMEYIEGGGMCYSGTWKVHYNDYANMNTKPGAKAAAKALRAKLGWHGISELDLAKEIYFHAVLYVKGTSKGLSDSTDLLFWNSVKDGIDIDNCLDKKKVAGIERYQYYNMLWG